MAKETNCQRICVDRPNSPTCNGTAIRHPGYISVTCVFWKVDNPLEHVSSIDIRSLTKYNVTCLLHSPSLTPEDHPRTSKTIYIIHLTPRLPLSYSMRTRILFVTATIYQDIFIYIIGHLKVYLMNHVCY